MASLRTWLSAEQLINNEREFPMKAISIAALALFAATPAFAGSSFLIDFEKNWDYGTAVDNTYAALGVSFTNVLGLSNTADFTYYTNAPSPLGVANVQLDGVVNTTAYMNVAGGVDNALSFFYSTPVAVGGAIKAYSGLNGTGTLLGTFDLPANDGGAYDTWTSATFAFAGTAQSFDLSATNGAVGFDNIAAVPEASTTAMLLAGLGLLGFTARRNRR
jgi:hypothetical protein